VDLIDALAYPLPVRVICALLSVPPADESGFTRWSRALSRSLDPSVLRSAEDDDAIDEAETGLVAYLEDLLAFGDAPRALIFSQPCSPWRPRPMPSCCPRESTSSCSCWSPAMKRRSTFLATVCWPCCVPRTSWPVCADHRNW